MSKKMFPIFFRIGNLSLRTYGLFVAIGVLVAYNYVLKNAYRRQVGREFVSNLSFFSLITGFLGARLLYVFLNFDYYKNDLLSVIKIWEGGLVLYGGILFGLIFGIIFIKTSKQNFLELCDLYAPSLFLGLSIGRLGCFFAGCCYGRETSSFLGIIFSNVDSLAPLGVKLFPTQLFESAYSILIFAVVHKFFINKKLRHKLLFFGLIFYSILRFFNEFLRGDYRGEYVFGLSPAQFISIILIILNFLVIVYITFRAKTSDKN
ncbi:MAG: prolipoprotein diacylglyceryl transferase [Endomicrobiia bacterium]